MSAATVLAIAIPIIVLIAAIGVISAARRRDTSDATGSLSRERVAATAASRPRCPSRRPS